MFVKNFINEFQFGTLCKSAGREFHSVKAQYNGDLRWISFFGRGKRIIWWLRCGIECVDAGTVHVNTFNAATQSPDYTFATSEERNSAKVSIVLCFYTVELPAGRLTKSAKLELIDKVFHLPPPPLPPPCECLLASSDSISDSLKGRIGYRQIELQLYFLLIHVFAICLNGGTRISKLQFKDSSNWGC